MSSHIYAARGGNPYRAGVLIGNYVEDMFGLDLKQKYGGGLSRSCNNIRNLSMSETKDQFCWPVYREDQLKNTGNDLTMSCSSNYDLNIDFNKKKVSDFHGLEKDNYFGLSNKNAFLPEEMKNERYRRNLENEEKHIIPQESLESTMESKLQNLHLKDTNGILYSKKNGLCGNLLFGHGSPSQQRSNNFASVYDLSHNQQISTQKFLKPNYQLDKQYRYGFPADKDYSDWGYRKYREYGLCTKKFDKKKKQ